MSTYAGWKNRKLVVQSWQRAWEHVTPFFAFPPKIRRVTSTTQRACQIDAIGVRFKGAMNQFAIPFGEREWRGSAAARRSAYLAQQ